MVLSGVSQKVFLDRYALKDKQGNPIEKKPEEMWRRIAKAVSSVEKKENQKKWEKEFYWAMKDFKYVPGGRILAGAGTGFAVTFYNCFVIPSPKDSRDGILETLKQMVEIMARGGGVGINLSSLRPRGARVKKVNGFSSGPVNWAELFSVATKDIIQQGGCFTGETKIMTHLGLIPIKEIVFSKKDYFVATHHGWKKVAAKFNNGTKDVYEVETEGGYKVKVTKEHRFVTFDENGNFYLQPLSSFKKGDYLVLLSTSFSDDIPEVILNTNLPQPSKFSFGRKKVNLPKTLNKNLAFILGVYAADGARIKDRYAFAKGIRFSVDAKRKKDLEFLIKAIKDEFGLTPKIKPGDGKVINISLYSRNLVEFLRLNQLIKDNSNQVFVPEQIFVSPKRVVEAFLAGVFFGDGGNRGKKGGFRITSVNKKFLEDIALLLLNLGIASKITAQKREKWQTLYTLNINGQRFMKRFFKIVEKYTEKAFDAPISYRDEFYNFPHNVLKRFVYLRGIQRTIAYQNPTTSAKTLMFLEQHFSSLKEEDIKDVEILVNTIPDKIKSINYQGKAPVFDLEVEQTHLLSGNGFYTSNSRRGALMLMLWDWHPDIEEFITVKQDLTKITGANLSLCVSDRFMRAVENDEDWQLIFPDTEDPDYDNLWDGDIENWLNHGKKVKVHKIVKAKKLWDLIAQAAWRSAEPGVVFMERYNKLYNNWYWNRINCVNPCVTGDTLVNTTLGIKTMRQLYEENRPFNVVVNGKKYLSTAVKLTGIKPVFKLKTKEGYQLRLTADHKVVTLDGPKEAGKLKIGDKILISFGGYFGNEGSFEEGLVLGWLVGDGAIKKDVATLYFYQQEKQTLAPHFALMVEKMVDGEQVVARPYPIGPQYIEKEDKAVIESARLWRIAKRFGLTFDNKYIVPEKVFQGSKEFQKGFLKGLFSSDGTVLGSLEKGASVRLTSVSEELLQKVQILLLNFGIFSKIYKERRPSQKRLLPDGKGGKKWYQCQAYHELVISKESLLKFAHEIGFLQEEKQKKLQNMLLSYQSGPYKENFIATFSQLIPDGQEEVFDITVANIHRFSANGLLVLNCGEEGLPPWGVCNLGSINLSALVKGDGIEKKARFDFKTLRKLVTIAVRFQDNVVDMDPYIFEGIRKTQLEGERRIGLGTMGLGDALIKLHLRYGSKESLKFIDKVYRIIRDTAYETAAEIAKEKGAFPKFDKELYLKGAFIKQLPGEIKEKIKKYGIRNSLLLMQAPTGSTSLMANTTSGIEPVFEFEFIRKDRLGTHIIRHHLYEQWYKKHEKEIKEGKIKKPEWFVSTNELTPEDHVYVQATIQKYVDASISKTVNAPKNHTVEDVKKLYTLAYRLGCKGITYFREGSRQGVLERKTEEKKEEKKPQNYIIKPRPMVVHGSTYRINTPVGIAFITINTNGGNPPEPLEVFINVGKAGTDVYAMAEGLGRMISLALRFSSHLSALERIKEIITQLSGIGGARTLGFGKEKIRSLPDAVAKVLAMHYNLNGNGSVKIEKENGPKENPKLITETTQPSLLLNKEVENFDICPSCGEASLVHEEGCKKCYSCGYSEC